MRKKWGMAAPQAFDDNNCGYGNHCTLANKWQEALVRLAFTPCLKYKYASGKNTSDIALALDAFEALFDRRADTFCVTSDSDFAYLCRKLRERGAIVHIVGEAKTPDALRDASDQVFEWQRPVAADLPSAVAGGPVQTPAPKPEPPKPAIKRRPKFIVDAVSQYRSRLGERFKAMDVSVG